jgi:hypothetical protein
MDQHNLTREQWEERISTWHAEHGGMLRYGNPTRDTEKTAYVWSVELISWTDSLGCRPLTLSTSFFVVVVVVFVVSSSSSS